MFGRPRLQVIAFAGLLRQRARGALLGLLVLVAFPVFEADAANDDQGRVALIIGNADYGFSRLVNPINDARALASSLRELGFEVDLVENAALREFHAALETMAHNWKPGGVGLFYFAGYAIQHQGINYLLPTDFSLDHRDLAAHAIRLEGVLGALERAEFGFKLVILDACRSHPFGDIDGAIGQGLALVDSPGETLVAYCSAPSQVAFDGAGPNSPYTAALISALESGHDVRECVPYRPLQSKGGNGGQPAAPRFGLDQGPGRVPRT
jgi:uncharacterized protein